MSLQTKSIRIGESLRILYIFFFLSPFVVLFFHLGGSFEIRLDELYSCFKFTLQQALLSSGLCLVLGFLGGIGLSAFAHKKFYSTLELFILAPALLPPLFTVLVYLNWVDYFFIEWSSLTAIVVNHVIINIGLFSVGVARLLRSRLSVLAEWAYVEGASRWTFYRFAGWKFLEKDLAHLFYFVFCICFMSFAVPLVVSGAEQTTLEMLVYEKVRQVNQVNLGVSYALVQVLMLFVLSFLLPKGEWYKMSHENSSHENNGFHRYGFSPFVLLPVLPAIVLLGTLLYDFVFHFHRFFIFSNWTKSLIPLFVNTVILGLVVAFITLLLSVPPLLYPKSKGIRLFLLGFSAPSTVIVGFAFYLLGVSSGLGQFDIGQLLAGQLLIMALALSLIFYPLVYRFFIDAQLASLRKQVEVAEVLGASKINIFNFILWPQLEKILMLTAFVSAFWSISDYALSSIVSGQKLTLGQEMFSILNSYRLELSFNLLMCLLVCAFLFYVVLVPFQRICRGRYKRS